MTSLSSSSTLPAEVRTLNSPEGIKHFLATVPAKIEQVLDRPPVSELIRYGAKKESIEACLALQITKVSNMLTVGGNLREGHALEIAIQLIADFPNESLEDFCLCLRRGIKGAYPIDGKSDIFRFDVLVINNWMRAYLDEKYQVAEKELMAEKETYKEQYIWKGAAQTLTDEVKAQKVKDRLKEWRYVVEGSKIEVREERREAPKRASGYIPMPKEEYDLKERIRREASEFYKSRPTYSSLKIFQVDGHDIFAESEADALTIYNKARI